MEIRRIHSWDVTPGEAVKIQHELQKMVLTSDHLGEVRLIAGADVAYSKERNQVYAAVCLFSLPDMTLVEQKNSTLSIGFPYIPGLLTFREGPALLECFGRLENAPDLIIFDGQGICHPRRMGIATHLGILLDTPSIGCAKSHLYGEFNLPAMERGSREFIRDHDGNVIGACLRTREGVRPVYVSTGHKISLETAINFVLRCAPRYRMPEPSRFAHTLAGLNKKISSETRA